ncbi:hypothetical protein BD830_105243 [Maritimibacter alkaliphilus HTCC2654]|uniref:Uncharacterized protein n=1 Tax=Maritimibacter alkaliphilus HTCC2654 TaxID=314271 RepID=A3VLF0_9RHOB|nr:hypothetical protein [Maritimibacter alkaliphilus]EAQ10955.1 hypothetical protein RB2654_05009 [Rhodobacterales bacterium HTCC2654] [Maritimibacter alkaliphilus HTCC2654]TYP81576.1 hypothetical protein BD830_105243 [Maritimibacter alkaliphilus HTCC2654]
MTNDFRDLLIILSEHAEEATIHNEGWDYHLEWRDGDCIVTQTKQYCID